MSPMRHHFQETQVAAHRETGLTCTSSRYIGLNPTSRFCPPYNLNFSSTNSPLLTAEILPI